MKNEKSKVYYCEIDGLNKFHDHSLILPILEECAQLSSLEECTVVHCVGWEAILSIPEEMLIGKRIICNMANRPFDVLKLPQFNSIPEMVSIFLVPSSEAERELKSVGINCLKIPEPIDTNTFFRLPENNKNLLDFRRKWKIPLNSYLIGKLLTPAENRGHTIRNVNPGEDVFIEIVRLLQQQQAKFHLVLAGTHGFGMTSQLEALSIPFTLIKLQERGLGDHKKTSYEEVLNYFYNCIDLYLNTLHSDNNSSRSIVESCAAQCKAVSTGTSLARELLDNACVYDVPQFISGLIKRDIDGNELASTTEPHYLNVLKKHPLESVTENYRRLYASVSSLPVCKRQVNVSNTNHSYYRKHQFGVKVVKRMLAPSLDNPLSVGIWHKYFSPPYGGGNQFIIALTKELKKQGALVIKNKISSLIDTYILNSVHFDTELFQRHFKNKPLKILHRIDGPIHLYRGTGPELDHKCFEMNAQLASATVLQSEWCYHQIVAMGYNPVRPTIIHNAVDPAIFNPKNRIPFSENRKIRLITTSWSDNPRKGGPIYKWIEDHLDWNQFEYTFVGRCSESFDKIKVIPPVNSHDLADILRQHDIYITASQKDPCSNALIEALSCGLPALYLKDGGHPELVGYGGLPFLEKDEILTKLDELAENYLSFQNMITVSDMRDVTQKYLSLLRDISDHE